MPSSGIAQVNCVALEGSRLILDEEECISSRVLKSLVYRCLLVEHCPISRASGDFIRGYQRRDRGVFRIQI